MDPIARRLARSTSGAAEDARVARAAAIVDEDSPHLLDVFKGIHANPELGFMEVRTAGIVAAELEALEFETLTGIGGTGVVGILTNGDGPTVMFRADMDANAVEEATGLSYASTVRAVNPDGIEAPVAHLCGHDAHTTWLISLARTMRAMRETWSGTLVLLAQPAEEPIEGAGAMLDDGLFAERGVPRPDYLIALHTAPLPTGTVIAKTGRLLTGSEHIDVVFHGVGGHGSAPQHAKDPVVMAATAILELQTVVSRRIDPAATAVLTIGSVQAGVDNNVIPAEATIKLKLHFESAEVRERMVAGIRSICDSIARSWNVPEDRLPTYRSKGYTPPVVNSAALVERARRVITDVPFAGPAIEGPPAAGSDDFARLVDGVEGVEAVYLVVGTASPAAVAAARERGTEFPFTPHEPDYVVDLDAIPVGAKLAAALCLDLM